MGAFRDRPDSSLEGRTKKQQQQHHWKIATAVDGLRACYAKHQAKLYRWVISALRVKFDDPLSSDKALRLGEAKQLAQGVQSQRREPAQGLPGHGPGTSRGWPDGWGRRAACEVPKERLVPRAEMNSPLQISREWRKTQQKYSSTLPMGRVSKLPWRSESKGWCQAWWLEREWTWKAEVLTVEPN